MNPSMNPVGDPLEEQVDQPGPTEAGRPGGERRQWRRDPVLLAALVATAAPFVVAVFGLLTKAWDMQAFDDNAVIELTTREAFTRPQLVGQVSHLVTRSLGPMMFWALAPFYWLTGGRSVGLWIGAAFWSCAAALTTVVLAWRRRGRGLALLTAALQLVLIATLGPHQYADPWNPSLTLLPLATVFMLAWGLAEGADWLAVPAVVLASYEAQTHLSMVIPTGVMILVALGFRWRLRAGVAPPATGTRAWVRPIVPLRRNALIAALVVGVVLWLPPVIDVALHPPGNLARVAKYTLTSRDHQTTLGDGVGAARFVVGIPPWFATGGPANDPNGLAVVAGAPVLPLGALLLVGFGVVAIRRRQRDLAVPLVVVGALVVAVVLSVWRLVGGFYLYVIGWAAVVSFLVWLVVLWSTWAECRPLVPRSWRSALPAVALVALGATTVHASAGSLDPPDDLAYGQVIAEASGAIRQALGSTRTVALRFGEQRTNESTSLDQALVLDLVRQGYEVFTPGEGKWYPERDRSPPSGTPVVWFTGRDSGGNAPAPPDTRRLGIIGDVALDLGSTGP